MTWLETMSVQDAFNQFCKERVRGVRGGYTKLVNEKTTLKELFKAYNRWQATSGSGAKKIDIKLFETLCDEAFGDSRGKQVYCHIRVFLDEDDLEDFEAENQKDEEILNQEKEIQTLKEQVAELTMKLGVLADQTQRQALTIASRDKTLQAFSDNHSEIIKEHKRRDKQLVKIIASLKTLLTLSPHDLSAMEE